MKKNALPGRSGVALVVVLSAITLLLALALGILTRAAVERRSAVSYYDSVSTRQLADKTVNLVQGQIHHATTQGVERTWASQPGMIRTFDDNGDLVRAYKLYSATSLTTGSVNLTEDLPPGGWVDQPSLWTDLNEPVRSDDDLLYPILTPSGIPAAGGTSPHVEGFAIHGAPGADEEQPAPMPVRWLYALEDGTLVSPEAGSGGSVTIPGATEENPIVGRVAFWTDDDTAKININTASEGTYFDMPRYATREDAELAAYQPALREFQRYPGHPATVNLSPVLGDILSRQQIYNVVPRIQEGGSFGGTVWPDDPIQLDTDRLYASVDELLLDPVRVPHQGVDRDVVERSRFFLTASSRAPELNLFNLPRVAFWPLNVNDDENFRNIHDRLIAFASTINGEPYYFQRERSDHPTHDYENISRNQDLYAYLQRLTDLDVPGFGGSFAAKYTPPERNQILTQIFDYIRSANLQDDTLEEPYRFTAGRISEAWSDFDFGDVSGALGLPGHGQVTPIQIGDTAGFGRTYTLSEVAFHFICTGDGTDDESGSPENEARKSSRYPPGWGYDAEGEQEVERDPEDAPDNRTLSRFLEQNERSVQLIIYVDLFSPMEGYPILSPDVSVQVEGLQGLQLNGETLFPNDGEVVHAWSPGLLYHVTRATGGPYGYFWPMHKKASPARGPLPGDNAAATRYTGSATFPADPAGSPQDFYPFISIPVIVTIDPDDPVMNFTGNTLTVRVYTGRAVPAPDSPDDAVHGPRPQDTFQEPQLIQTATLNVPSATLPAPNLVTVDGATPSTDSTQWTIDKEYWWSFTRQTAMVNHETGDPLVTMTRGSIQFDGGRLRGSGTHTRAGNSIGIPSYGNRRLPLNDSDDFTFGAAAFIVGVNDPNDSWAFDVVRSMVVDHGDFRLTAARSTVPSGEFVPLGDWNSPAMFIHTLRRSNHIRNNYVAGWDEMDAGYVDGVNYVGWGAANHGSRPKFHQGASAAPSATGDWDAGLPYSPDGAYINMPDHGNTVQATLGGADRLPYMDGGERQTPVTATFFTPNRIMPSPGMIGSLPTGVARNRPWETLLFRPQEGHPNSGNPPDALWMDLFWMPVVEPYAISEPFSTAGKINMNYQILPFTYIDRSTGVRAVLQSEKVVAVGNNHGGNYKRSSPSGNITGYQNRNYRLDIDVEETLTQFQDRFDGGDVFRTAAEITSLHLVPEGQRVNTMNTFWNAHQLTGDNVRERPYALVYPKLTTRSNTYTVHFRVQSLRQPTNLPPNQWNEQTGAVVGEYRGSVTMERYIDPNNPEIPDYATIFPENIGSEGGPRPLDDFYRWRIVANRQFAP